MGLRSSSHLYDVPNEYTGMTKKQMMAIKKSWQLLQKEKRKHSIKIFVRLFRKYPIYRRYFLDIPGVKMSDLARHAGVQSHCDAFMKAMDRMLNAAIKKPEAMSYIYCYQARCHKDMAVGEIECQRMTETIIDYMRKEFPEETTDYVADCWKQFLDMATYQYVTKMEEYFPEDEEEELIPVHASRKQLSNREKKEKEFWDKHHEYWRSKKSTWIDTNATTMTIEDEENEDSYINDLKNDAHCCGLVPTVTGEKKKKSFPPVKPVARKEITVSRSLATIKEVQIDLDEIRDLSAPEVEDLPTSFHSGNDHSKILRNQSRLVLDNNSRSEMSGSNRSPLDVRIRASVPPNTYERRLSDLFQKQEVLNDKHYVTPSYVPGRNLDDMDIPLPKFLKKERPRKSSLAVSFNSQTMVHENISQESVADGPRERRRKWNEFTSCCNKRYSYY